MFRSSSCCRSTKARRGRWRSSPCLVATEVAVTAGSTIIDLAWVYSPEKGWPSTSGGGKSHGVLFAPILLAIHIYPNPNPNPNPFWSISRLGLCSSKIGKTNPTRYFTHVGLIVYKTSTAKSNLGEVWIYTNIFAINISIISDSESSALSVSWCTDLHVHGLGCRLLGSSS